MMIKVLLLNINLKKPVHSDSLEITEKPLIDLPTLHDYHVIILGTDEMGASSYVRDFEHKTIRNNYVKLKNELLEQTKTGGWVFALMGPTYPLDKYNYMADDRFTNNNWLPDFISIISESGTSFQLNPEQVKYYSPLIKAFQQGTFKWNCHIDHYPKESKIIATNRAGYPIFIEVPNKKGKYILLPNYERQTALDIILNQIIPNVIKIDNLSIPDWVSSFNHPIEEDAKNTLSDFSKAKRIIYTNDKGTEKASAFILERLGFKVKVLPDGTNPDLRIVVEGIGKGIVEIKGHENRQTNKNEVLQVISYQSDSDITEKGVVISNHEFKKLPNERALKAFTDGAIDTANKNDISLLSSVDLWRLFILAYTKRLDKKDYSLIQEKIMKEKGIIQFEDIYQKYEK